MPEFAKPVFDYSFHLSTEVRRLRLHRDHREIPPRAPGELLIATWNIANFGAQDRLPPHRHLIAEIVSWFDVVAIQEVRDNFAELEDLLERLPSSYRTVFSDVAGNNERMAFIYDSKKLTLLEKIGEIAVPPGDHRYIKLEGVTSKFSGFDRNPYLASFRIGRTSIILVNVHLYFGSESKANVERRSLETYAVARWADLRRKSQFAFTRELIVLGDFNMPKALPGDPIYDALTKRGLELPEHSSEVGSSIASDHQYDQIAFLPGETKNCFTGRKGVFDFDGVIFRKLWEGRGERDFRDYLRYYISDHRPMWIQIDYPE